MAFRAAALCIGERGAKRNSAVPPAAARRARVHAKTAPGNTTLNLLEPYKSKRKTPCFSRQSGRGRLGSRIAGGAKIPGGVFAKAARLRPPPGLCRDFSRVVSVSIYEVFYKKMQK